MKKLFSNDIFWEREYKFSNEYHWVFQTPWFCLYSFNFFADIFQFLFISNEAIVPSLNCFYDGYCTG